MTGPGRSAGGGVAREQVRYAGVLDVAMKAGLAVLAASFAAYVFGLLPPHVPLDALPRVWSLPVGDYLRAARAGSGWHWLTQLGRGDMLTLGAIALLAGVSLPCLALLAADYARQRDWAYLAITLSLIAVLGAAASGLIGSH
jgi:hypothetical protein